MLENKVAVVTGSGRGIGEAIVRTLAEYGASVIVADVDEGQARRVATDLKESGMKAEAVYLDVADFNRIRQKVADMRDVFGRIDIWVNNAGITENASVEQITEAQWDRMHDIDLKSVFFCTQAVFEVMKEQRYGKLVHISSMAGERAGRKSSASYSAAKAGVINLAKSFALHGGQYGITSNAVCPGRTLTSMADQLGWVSEDPSASIPLGRYGTPEDIAKAVLFYASDLSSYVTGDAMRVNGGLYM